ncbi:MAG: excinuclease ABC subunit UvrA, partial [Lutibacter sp.]|nr:excinuclease ABC subunit UvrA [Lutibacter sp.]
MAHNQAYIEVFGARVHNLKNIDVRIPREKLVVITGLSGSGKSSLAFDTIYAEGQRRYIETFSAYARQFLGGLERPDVDKIEGLSPVISIEQKTTNRNPRSTVGTITEIYDFLRLLYARASEAYSYQTQQKMVSYNDTQIKTLILETFAGQKITVLAPVVRSRKGHYRELFEQVIKQGFVRVRVDGEIRDLEKGMRLDRYKTHDIEIVIDRLVAEKSQEKRLEETITTALYSGENVLMVLGEEKAAPRYFSRDLMCPDTGISYPKPEPNTFSFNSPKGACPSCNGLGKVYRPSLRKIIPDDRVSIKKGGIAPLGEEKNSWIFKQIRLIAQRYDFELTDPISSIPKAAMDILLNGGNEKFEILSKSVGITRNYEIDFEGIVHFISHQFKDTEASSIKRWARNYMDEIHCETCRGDRLKKSSLFFRVHDKNIAELSAMDIEELAHWFENIEEKLSERQLAIAREILKEIRTRIGFLLDVGLSYLNLDRSTRSLSGGEAQRIRLATQIGSQLVGVLYILDEPSIGLHQRDNQKLINSLINLRNIGNTVVVVEHDKEMIEQADFILDIGPGAGIHGGEIVSKGSVEKLKEHQSLTASYLNGGKCIEVPTSRRSGNGKKISLIGANGNNLKNIGVDFPLGMLICVTGVSGSGKSTLVNETLYPILNKHLYRGVKKPMPYESIQGLEHVDKVIAIDQSPIGRTPRSNPATYTGVFGEIRALFAKTSEA